MKTHNPTFFCMWNIWQEWVFPNPCREILEISSGRYQNLGLAVSQDSPKLAVFTSVSALPQPLSAF